MSGPIRSRTSDGREVRFRTLAPGDFPLIIELMTAAGSVVHRQVVQGPGVIEIPALGQLFGPLTTKITYGTGEVVVQPPKGGRRP
jgi:hypothetical protein